MTAQFLQNELTNLVQEAKRKNSELRHATEKSLADLKSIGPAADISAELASRPGFLSPFLIACSTRNAKFSTIGVVCLQRLIVSKALAKSRLKEVLEAFREAANLGVDIQLKILQSLPPLLQNYADNLQGALLGEALLICSILQGSKMGVVNNTAAATLSQIVISIFEKVVTEDERQLEIPAVGEAPTENGNIPVRPAALDAYKVFYDICLLTEGQSPRFLRFRSLPQPFGLELIESVLTNAGEIFLSHPEQAHILRTQVAPLVLKVIADRINFPTTVRVTRVLYMLLRRHLSILSDVCEHALSLLTHMLEPDSSQPWKRALCLEVFKGLCLEPILIRKIFSAYDAQEGKKPIIGDLMMALSRLTQEKPNLIGLGYQSSAPVGLQVQKDASSEQAALEAGGVAGIIGGAVGLGDVTVPGLSTQWSVVRVPCIDQLDKTEAPAIPDTYVYYLTLMCINSFSEGLAKFILPLASGRDDPRKRLSRTASIGVLRTTASDSEISASRPDTPARTPSPTTSTLKKRLSKRPPRVPVNPLTLESHPLYADIKISAAIAEACWPAILAACSTFLIATLDNEFYHGLVRGFQKFAHVAGLLRLTTPRDAFLTTLGKSAVPPNVVSANLPSSPMAQTPSGDHSLLANAKGFLGVESGGPGTDRPSPGGSDSSLSSPPSLNSRNLLCLRALLNLGIALGPTLDKSWTIILKTLQQADFVLFASSRRSGRQLSLNATTLRSDSQKSLDSNTYLMSNIGPELTAVEAATGKMFESTRDFPDDAFVSVLDALCKLLDSSDTISNGRPSIDQPRSSTSSSAPRVPAATHRRTGSVGSLLMASQIIGDNAFALAKMGDLAQINMARLIGPNPTTTGWDLLIGHLITIAGSRDVGNSVRMKAAEVLYDIVVSAAKTISSENTENVAEVQRRILTALKEGVDDGSRTGQVDSATRATELEIHRTGLEALNAILEHAGQSLIAGWEIVFDIIASVFDASMVWRRDATANSGSPSVSTEVTRSTKSPRLIRTSFSSLELICSDFLTSLPTSCVLVLVDALFAFSSQKDDINISLTTITFFWNVSDFLQSKGESATKGEMLTAEAESEKDLLDIVERTDGDAHSALWMLLLLRLTGVSKDFRAEVRNGSIQTLFRIFDTYGHQLGPRAWSCCLKIVVFKMMNINPRDLDIISNSKMSERKQWDDTIKLVLIGIGTLYSNYFDIFRQQADFRKTWSVFMQYLQSLLTRKSLEVSTTVFDVLARVIDKVQQPEDLDTDSREELWVLWAEQGVTLVEGDLVIPQSGNPIQEALTSYVEAFKSLYRLLQPTLTATIVQKSLDILRECILFPDAPSYFQDIDILTPLQAVILEAVQLIRTDIPTVASLLLKQLAEFSTVAYNDSTLRTPPKGKIPTYIALSTSSMKLLETISLKHILDAEIYTSGALPTVLSALAVPVQLKYAFTPNVSASTRRPSQWVLATNVVLELLKKAVPAMDALPSLAPHHREQVWAQIVAIITGVVSAPDTGAIDEVTLRKDEAFDIEAFDELRKLIIPTLGRNDVPEETVAAHVRAVFESSLLYAVDRREIEQDPDNMEVRLGRTSEIRPVRRNRMAYVCLDELFALVAGGAQEREEVRRLARIAAPWFVKRVRIVLVGYIADQPLRGRMPMPSCQRKEIIYVIKKTVALESGLDTVVIESPHIPPSSRRHLFKLVPLVSRCIPVAARDPQLLELFSEALDEMGAALGIAKC